MQHFPWTYVEREQADTYVINGKWLAYGGTNYAWLGPHFVTKWMTSRQYVYAHQAWSRLQLGIKLPRKSYVFIVFGNQVIYFWKWLIIQSCKVIYVILLVRIVTLLLKRIARCQRNSDGGLEWMCNRIDHTGLKQSLSNTYDSSIKIGKHTDLLMSFFPL